ncbi:MAG: SOS response-associated peptidase [Acidobacteriota bacterium]|jgi:putative SOS response-associated peptidase YedK
MCGRYTLTTTGSLIGDLFDLRETPQLAPRYNIAPSQAAPVVRRDESSGDRVLERLRWGLVPAWSREPPGAEARMINARSETAASKPAFRDPLRRRRCLVPADGFFEWRKEGGRKQPLWIRMQDGRPFAFAGLWDRWHPDEGEPIDSFTILTIRPNELVATIHDRMPVILPRKAFDPWLDPGREAEALLDLLGPYPAAEMSAVAVSPRVGNPANDDPSLIEPYEPAPRQPDLFG